MDLAAASTPSAALCWQQRVRQRALAFAVKAHEHRDTNRARPNARARTRARAARRCPLLPRATQKRRAPQGRYMMYLSS
jgi:hypothetical protein